MPHPPLEDTGQMPLPEGWEVATDFDGKVFFIDHKCQKTSWIDPRDRYTKPPTFADCVGDELPYGWEESYSPHLGVYYTNHVNQVNQLEDPRLQWREQQEAMLKEYLAHAHEDLEAKREIYTVKQERLAIAQEEVIHLKDTLEGHWKASRTSLNSSCSSASTKYDPDLLKQDVQLAKNRLVRLRRELEQIQQEMVYKQQGLQTLQQVEEKMAGQQSVYNVDQAQEIMERIRCNQKSLTLGEKEKQELMQGLVRLKEEVLMPRPQLGSSPDVSTLSIPHEKFSIASQTDLSGEYAAYDNRWVEIARMRLQYDEARRQVSDLQQQLASIEEQMIPGQNESDKDRLLLIQEKEQLLRELRGISAKGRSEEEMTSVRGRIKQLELDLKNAMEQSSKQIAERLQLNETKSEILQRLAEATRVTAFLESQLKNLSMSTLSISSGSSRGSLGSLSASSKGSLASLSFTDIYYGQQSQVDVNLPELHRRVEKLLQGHSTSPLEGVPEVTASLEEGLVASTSECNLYSSPLIDSSSVSHSVSLSLPSPYDICPPPSYEQHIERQRQAGVGPGVGLSQSTTSLQSRFSDLNLNALQEEGMDAPGITTATAAAAAAASGWTNLNANAPPTVVCNTINIGAKQPAAVSSSPSLSANLRKPVLVPHLPLASPETVDNAAAAATMTTRRTLTTTDAALDAGSNPPLSPISESTCSSGVCNNMSGGGTRSVSAAVSDESVAGDSGVFEASMKRSGELDDVFEMSLESAQVQIKLKYDSTENHLLIGVEQARNLAVLGLPEHSEVCVKAALLPSVGVSFQTSTARDLSNPKFHQIFKTAIAENKLTSKTLQVHVWCIGEKGQEECLGSAQVSLASFDPRQVSIQWYNVLSFKFMQSELPGRNIISSSSSNKVSSIPSSLPTLPPMQSGDRVTHLLEASSARLRRTSFGSEDRPQSAGSPRDARYRSASIESGTSYRPIHPASGTITSLKEESSDESTIISSQTSTLTRNQGPEDMERHEDDVDCTAEWTSESRDEEEEEEEDEYYIPGHYQANLAPFLMNCGSDIPEEGEYDFSPDGTVKIVTCDKETITDLQYSSKDRKKRAAENSRAPCIRRSKTFSPATGTMDYVCKLNRSDSDTSVKCRRGAFHRNAIGRQSLRIKRDSLSIHTKSKSLSCVGRPQARTSIDLELDLQASETRLNQQKEEIARLKGLKKKFEEAKEKGENEPSWLTDNEHLQQFLVEADKVMVKQDRKNYTRVDEKAEKMLKKATKQAHRQKQQPDATHFREKMAFFTSVNLSIPVLTSEVEHPDYHSTEVAVSTAPLSTTGVQSQ